MPSTKQISAKQQALLIELLNLSPYLHKKYLGALQTWYSDNPDRQSLAAYGLRDLMNSLSDLHGKPIKRTRLGDLFNSYKPKWEKFQDQVLRTEGRPGGGNARKETQTILRETEKFMNAGVDARSSRKELIRETLSHYRYGPELSEERIMSKVKKWCEVRDFFVGIAHQKEITRVADCDFNANLTILELHLCELLCPETSSVRARLDKLIVEANPTQSTVKEALQIIQHGSDYSYFYKKLKSEQWLKPLMICGEFKNPPPIVPQNCGVSFPHWPPAYYLARVALNAPYVTSEIISKVSTDNPIIVSMLLEAIIDLPSNLAVSHKRKIAAWVKGDFVHHYSEHLAKLCSQWFSSGFAREAMYVTSRTLGIIQGQTDEFGFGNARAQIGNTYEFDKFVRSIVDSLPCSELSSFLRQLCVKLKIAMFLGKGAKSSLFADGSIYWRGSIEPSNQNGDEGLRSLLVDWIRDVAEKVAIQEGIESVLDLLHSYNHAVFWRIGLHCTRIHPQKHIVVSQLLDRKLFESTLVWHEYALLLQSSFEELGAENKYKLLSWISDVGALRVTQEDNRTAQFSRLRYYTMISDYLEGAVRVEFEDLRSELGELEHPTFHCYKSTWWCGPESPLTPEELSFMSVEKVANFLGTWTPKGDFDFGPCKIGLGRALTEAVAREPQKYLRQLNAFEKIDLSYATSLIYGFTQALNQKNDFDWLDVVGYIERMFKRSKGNPSDFSSAKTSIARFMEQSLRKEDRELSNSQSELIWNLIINCYNDSSPSAKTEKSQTSDGNYYSVAINSTRGSAAICSIQYGLWKLRCKKPLLPQLLHFLSALLDKRVESSLAVHSVLGRYFPVIRSMNPQWADSAVQLIFPFEDDLERAESAWRAYLEHNQIFDRVLEPLRKVYSYKVEQLFTKEKDPPDSLDKQLIRHIFAFYLRGTLAIDDPLLDGFQTYGTCRHRNYALSDIGQAIGRKELPEDFTHRAKRYWEFRRKTLDEEPQVDASELASFGWWLGGDALDRGWQIDQLLYVLGRAKAMHNPFMVVRFLLSVVEEFPAQVAIAIDWMVTHRVDGANMFFWVSKTKPILEALLEKGFHAHVLTTSDKLLAHGYDDFRGLADASRVQAG